jgi:hypothetical protein
MNLYSLDKNEELYIYPFDLFFINYTNSTFYNKLYDVDVFFV